MDLKRPAARAREGSNVQLIISIIPPRASRQTCSHQFAHTLHMSSRSGGCCSTLGRSRCTAG